jgi:peptidyl-tRNA hydrolase
MPIFLIERNFAEKLQVTPEGAAEINEINDQESVRWLISFLSVDKKKTFCLYEASSAEAIRRAAERAGIPADVIIEVGEEIVPSGNMQALSMERFN